jgi:hypothetical protein
MTVASVSLTIAISLAQCRKIKIPLPGKNIDFPPRGKCSADRAGKMAEPGSAATAAHRACGPFHSFDGTPLVIRLELSIVAVICIFLQVRGDALIKQTRLRFRTYSLLSTDRHLSNKKML